MTSIIIKYVFIDNNNVKRKGIIRQIGWNYIYKNKKVINIDNSQYLFNKNLLKLLD
jgi:hypothetical protein